MRILVGCYSAEPGFSALSALQSCTVAMPMALPSTHGSGLLLWSDQL
jgi:hypothetical protein